MRLYLSSPPAKYPLSDKDVTGHLRVDTDEELARIKSIIIPTATSWAQTYTGRAFITQTWKMYLDSFPGCYGQIVNIPRPNLQTVSSVKYYDMDGVLTTYSAANYTVEAPTGPQAPYGRIWPNYNTFWPIPTRVIPNAVEITFVAGWGADDTFVPGDVKAAMLLICGELFERRENANELIITNVPLSAMNLLSPYMVGL